MKNCTLHTGHCTLLTACWMLHTARCTLDAARYFPLQTIFVARKLGMVASMIQTKNHW